MKRDIVERLREPNDGVLSHKWGEMRRTMKEAADEIERLRTLITEWADTHYENGPFSVAHQNAIDALRAEVGR